MVYFIHTAEAFLWELLKLFLSTRMSEVYLKDPFHSSRTSENLTLYRLLFYLPLHSTATAFFAFSFFPSQPVSQISLKLYPLFCPMSMSLRFPFSFSQNKAMLYHRRTIKWERTVRLTRYFSFVRILLITKSPPPLPPLLPAYFNSWIFTELCYLYLLLLKFRLNKPNQIQKQLKKNMAIKMHSDSTIMQVSFT